MIRELASSYPDDFHRLERSLRDVQDADRALVIQFTSSRYNEGVTTTTLAFALFLASMHKPDDVVVVEANLRQPSFKELLNLDGDASLMFLLDDTKDHMSIVSKEKDFGFSVVPAGEVHFSDQKGPLQTDEVTYESFLKSLGSTLDELRKSYRFILVDSPPVIPFMDASIIAPMTDGVVVLVQANLTRSEVLEHSIDKIESVGGKTLGVVLNKRVFHIPKWIYRFL